MFPALITDLLQNGHRVRFKAPGHSMFPTIMADETLLVEPIEPSAVRRGDIILYRCNGNLIAHRVMAIVLKTAANEYASLLRAFSAAGLTAPESNDKCSHDARRLFILRGDAARSFDEPVEAQQVLGKVIGIQRRGRCLDPYSFKHRLIGRMFVWALRIKNHLGFRR